MTTYFVTRHTGASDWAQQHGITARIVAHLDPEIIVAGDNVLGTLPVHIAAQICAHDARYFHLILEVPETMRGQELTAEDMTRLGARLAEYRIERRD